MVNSDSFLPTLLYLLLLEQLISLHAQQLRHRPSPISTNEPGSMRPPAPSELSSLGDLHDAGSSVASLRRSSSRALSIDDSQLSLTLPSQPPQSQAQFPQTQQQQRTQATASADVRGEVPSADLRGVSALLVGIGATTGMVLAIVIAQIGGARDSAFVHWLLLPGKLYANALLCAVLPAVLLNAALGTMHFAALNKTKALASKMLLYFFAATLTASVLGALLALCFVPTFTENSALRLVASAGRAGNGTASVDPLVEFRCPQENYSQALLVQPDGSMRCAQPLEVVNSTRFWVEDLAHTFQLASTSSNSSSSSSSRAPIPTIRDQLVTVLESLFPMNFFESFYRGDVLSVLIIGAALGLALLRFSFISSIAGTSDSSLLFLLFIQGEVVMSMLLRALLRMLPVGMAFMVCGALLRSPRDADVSQFSPSMQDLASLVGVLLFALVLNVAAALALAVVRTKANPLPFMRRLIPAQLVALGTSSSLLALPTTVRSIAATRQISMPLAHLVCSTGAVLNKTGTAAYLSVSSVYIVALAGLQGDAFAGMRVVSLVLASVLCAIALPPMPRGSILVVGTILSSVLDIQDSFSGGGGVHALVAFLAAMDWLCDPLVSVVNVTSSAVVALVLAVEMDERFRDPSFGSTQEEETDDGMSATMATPGRPPHAGLGLQHQISSISSEVMI